MSKDGRYDAGAWMRRSGVSAPRDAFIELQEQILGYAQDGRYDAGAWMRRSGVSASRVRYSCH